MKTEKYILKILMLIVAVITVISALAQDSHFSMSQFNKVMLNPAITGQNGFNQIRCVSQFRTQWAPLGTKITTTTFAADMPLKERWGIGTYILNNDGSKIFNTFNWVLSGAYQIASKDQLKHRLSVGLQAGFIHKSINDRDFVFNNQYYNGYFDPDLPNYEKLVRHSVYMPEFNYGIYYRYTDEEQKIHGEAGFVILHITSPSQSFYRNEAANLPRRWIFHGSTDYLTSINFMVFSDFMYQIQGNVSEFICNVGGKYLNVQENLNFIITFGYRHNDAVIISVGCDYKNLQFKSAYDITISKLSNHISGASGIEIGLIYLINK